MQTILLIRHADAKNREKWTQPDHLRPLTASGKRQAQAIADELATSDIKQIRTSPAIRCVQTVEPLAARTKLKLRIDDALMEGSNFQLPDEAANGLHIYCAHGDNIPALLDDLGIEWKECQKGSIWLIKRDGAGEITEVAYVPPEG
jgi:8-oxo-(d)GTP phosphatase